MTNSHAVPPVDLDNCAREPIHIPGAIQQHGALLSFAPDGILAWVSGNAASVLGEPGLAPGQAAARLQPALAALAAQELALPADTTWPRQHDAALATGAFDAIAHRSGDQLVIEFEPRDHGDEAAAFAIQAHRSLEVLRRQRTLQALLETAVAEVRALTGFDRVMAYRFRHDASGDIVAETRRTDLEPLLGRRYPASDIPQQARQLYVVNTLRLIADVQSAPVPLLGPPHAPPLDLTQSVLRSVSPVHIEYLTNMGVCASMSVSIVIDGQLWGMLACHHYGPRRVPYSVRMVCDVLAQLLAANVQSLLAAQRSARLAEAAESRTRLASALLLGEDPIAALGPLAGEAAASLEADAVVVTYGGRVATSHEVPGAGAQALAAWLLAPPGGPPRELVALDRRDDWASEAAAALPGYAGVLALPFDEPEGGWLVALRREQVETVEWGGRPEKNYVNGPLGPRLTPRGSFAVWRETVHGTAVPWNATDLSIARMLRGELARVSAARQAEHARARQQMLAVLGHDLRNPLQTISMSAHLLHKGGNAPEVGRRIQTASSRMQRLISQVLDMARLENGLGLGFTMAPLDLAALVGGLLDEDQATHPSTPYLRALASPAPLQGDADRIAQMLGNMLSNARAHGDAGHAIQVSLRPVAGGLELAVANRAAPIPAEVLPQLFTPFKRQSLGNVANPGGLGLGLHIAREIARGHGGDLGYRYQEGHVVFAALLAPGAPGS